MLDIHGYYLSQLTVGTAMSVSQAMTSIFQELCDCNMTAASFQDFTLSCSPTSVKTGGFALFTSSLIYSSDNGSITASMLVDMLQAHTMFVITVLYIIDDRSYDNSGLT